MPNYLEVLSGCYPGVEAYTVGDPTVYEDIVWVSAPISQAELDASQCATDPGFVLAAAVPDELVVDKIFDTMFMYHSKAKNKWLSTGSHDSSSSSDEIPFIIPFGCKLISLTFANEEDDASTDIEIWRSPWGSEPNSSAELVYTWEVRNARAALSNSLPTIHFSQGDKIAIFLRDQGKDADTPFVRLSMLITSYVAFNDTDAFSTDF